MRWTATVVAALLLAAACGDDAGAPNSSTSPTSASTSTSTSPVNVEAAPIGSGQGESPWPAELGGDHQAWTVRVVERLPHDTTAFTQGLEFTDRGLIESTGRYGESTLRLTDPRSGDVLETIDLDPRLFGEGVTVVHDEIVQLTWRAGRALRYGADLSPQGEFTYAGEGWGICFDGTEIWTTDGTSELTQRRADGFTPTRSVIVTRDGQPVERLNELECIGDHVVANVWQTDEIVVIDPVTGIVDATIDAAVLRAEVQPSDGGAVLNGIADAGDGTLLLGGKLWPTHFVVEIVAAD